MRFRAFALVALALAAATSVAPAAALPLGQALHPMPVPERDTRLPPALQDVGIGEKLGAGLPVDARFRRQDGAPVRLGDLLHGRPVLLSLVYFNCPMLCGLVLTGEARGVRESGLKLGKDFDAVTVSFDPLDTMKVAAERQRGYLQAAGAPEARQAWTFLTGEAQESRRVADAVGFRYAYDEKTKQFAHPAAIIVLTPDGHVSRYLYGIEYAPRDLRLALVEAGQGRVGTSFDHLLLTCFRYDPTSRRYEAYVLGFVRLSMLAVLVGLGAMLGVFWRREFKAKRAGAAPKGKEGAPG
ncbi:MAG TPA: SCO family protein [Anaeromyxobacteraceae bacterium]|nr:SCO family protein [Anaeromyxobacteraceae bacterium]